MYDGPLHLSALRVVKARNAPGRGGLDGGVCLVYTNYVIASGGQPRLLMLGRGFGRRELGRSNIFHIVADIIPQTYTSVVWAEIKKEERRALPFLCFLCDLKILFPRRLAYHFFEVSRLQLRLGEGALEAREFEDCAEDSGEQAVAEEHFVVED